MSIMASEWRYQHKAGQLRSTQRVSCILLVILIVIIYVAHDQQTLDSTPPIEKKVGRALISIPLLGIQQNLTGGPGRFFGGGLVANYRIIPDVFLRPALVTHSISIVPVLPNVGLLSENTDNLINEDTFMFSDNSLPAPKSMARVYPARIKTTIEPSISNLQYPAHLFMNAIEWPDDIILDIVDTPSVSGLITLHSNGKVSFIMHEQTHAGLSFDIAVHRAMQQATCTPATNYRGAKITITTPYRCIFLHGSATINSTRAVLGTIRNDFH